MSNTNLDLNLNIECDYTNNDEYRDTYLKIFKLDNFDEEVINSQLANIKNIIVKNDIFRELLTKSAGLYLTEDLDIGLMILFSYDYLKDFTQCLNDFIIYSKTEKINELIKKIKK
tara:strand:- start:458 stop:802 length:345 start_codon:yes stop_codon:yes gene_type:complete